MGIINLTPPDYTLEIAGYDCTGLLTSVSASYPQWSPGTGLLISSAQWTLNDTYEFREVLSDLLNGRWAYGRRIVFRINGKYAPICGTHYIVNAAFDGTTLTISSTDVLGIHNFASPASLGVCINIAETASAAAIINTMLQGAGIHASFIGLAILTNVNSLVALDYQIVQDNTSFVQLAGQLAGSNGYILYQAPDGTVELADVTSIIRHKIAIACDDFQLAQGLDRMPPTEPPPSSIVVTGSVADRYETDKVKAYTIQERLQYGIQTTTRNVETDFEQRTIKTTTSTYAPIGDIAPGAYEGMPDNRRVLVEYTSELAEFEPGDAQPPADVAILPAKKCTKQDEGRMYKRFTNVFQDALIGLQAWNEVGLAAGTIKKQEELVRGNIRTSDIAETWEFNLPKPVTTLKFGNTESTQAGSTQFSANKYRVDYKRITRRAVGVELPIFAKYLDKLVLSPLTMITAEVEQITWKLDTNQTTWTRTRTIQRTRYSQNPEQTLAMLSNQQRHPLSTTVASARSLITVLVETEEDNPPPAPSRMPAKAYNEYTPFEAKYNALSDTKVPDKRQYYSLGTQISTAADAMSIAETYARWQVGRYKALNVTVPLSIVDPATYDLFLPVGGTAVIRVGAWNTLYHLAMDGISLLFTTDEAVINFAGVLIGSQGPMADFATQIVTKPGSSDSLGFGEGGRNISLGGIERNTALKDDLVPQPIGDGSDSGGELNSYEALYARWGDDLLRLPDVNQAYPNISNEYPRISLNNDPELSGDGDFTLEGGGGAGGNIWFNKPAFNIPNASFPRSAFPGYTSAQDLKEGRSNVGFGGKGSGREGTGGGLPGGLDVTGSLGSSSLPSSSFTVFNVDGVGIGKPYNPTGPRLGGGGGVGPSRPNQFGGSGVPDTGGNPGGGYSSPVDTAAGNNISNLKFFEFWNIDAPKFVSTLGAEATLAGVLSFLDEYWAVKNIALTSM